MEESDEHAYDKAQYPILLKQYYMRLFPYEKYYQWLSYSEGTGRLHLKCFNSVSGSGEREVFHPQRVLVYN